MTSSYMITAVVGVYFFIQYFDNFGVWLIWKYFFASSLTLSSKLHQSVIFIWNQHATSGIYFFIILMNFFSVLNYSLRITYKTSKENAKKIYLILKSFLLLPRRITCHMKLASWKVFTDQKWKVKQACYHVVVVDVVVARTNSQLNHQVFLLS